MSGIINKALFFCVLSLLHWWTLEAPICFKDLWPIADFHLMAWWNLIPNPNTCVSCHATHAFWDHDPWRHLCWQVQSWKPKLLHGLSSLCMARSKPTSIWGCRHLAWACHGVGDPMYVPLLAEPLATQRMLLSSPSADNQLMVSLGTVSIA